MELIELLECALHMMMLMTEAEIMTNFLNACTGGRLYNRIPKISMGENLA